MAYINNKALYDITTENAIIGYVLNFPSLLLEEEFPLTTDDFHNKRNQILYGVANNMAIEGVNKINPADVDIYLRRFPEQYAIYEENQGIESIMAMTESTSEVLDKAKFNILYKRLRKFSVLRDLEKSGISTDDFYSDNVFDENNNTFEESSIEDFLTKVKSKINDIEEKYKNKLAAKGISIADGLKELIEQYKITPDVGATMDGEIYNYAVHGAQLGRMYLTSSNSGGGKTRRMVGQACALSLPYINEFGKIVMKKEYHPTLFISTEQDVRQIQTMVLAYVSGVNEEQIKNGMKYCSEDELNRIDIAIKILELFKDYLLLEQIPDPSIGLVKSKILQYIYKRNVQYIFFDYIFTSPSLMSEFSRSGLREDVILLMLSNALKEIATTYDVFIMSGTQLSGDYDKPIFRGMGFLRGSKAIADKVDTGAIVIRLKPEELEKVQPIIEVTKQQPNVVSDLYKNRSGSLTEVKIFSYFDYGTCRMRDMFITDLSYNILDLENRVVYKEETECLDSIEQLTESFANLEAEEHE